MDQPKSDDPTTQQAAISRRGVLLAAAGAIAALPLASVGTAHAATTTTASRKAGGSADVVFVNGRITTLDSRHPTVTALAVRGDRVLATGSDHDVRRLAGPGARVIDLHGRRMIPGLNDSHTHLIREGLSYTSELSLAGVTSVTDALALIKFQADRTPAPQWIRVIGGFTRFQFREQRLPTADELNAAVPDKPVLLLHLYDRALLNRTALRLLGIDRNTPEVPGSQIERDAAGNPTGLLIAKPNPTLLYNTLAKLPALDPESQVVSTRQYLRHLNTRGVTSVMDAAGGGQVYPDNYGVVNQLRAAGELTVRIGYSVFPRSAGTELADYRHMVEIARPGDGDGYLRLAGAGEVVLYSAVDWEDFEQPRPELSSTMEAQLRDILTVLGGQRWPFRLHTTYDQSITRMLDVIEAVHGPDGPGVRFILDHAETISPANIDRTVRLGGAFAVQHRMAFQGEVFEQRYGAKAAALSPPVWRMMQSGAPVGLGTDATRVASDNVWTALHWFTTGRTVGGRQLYRPDNILNRVSALELLTMGSARLSGEDAAKGTLTPGKYADLAVLTEDYLTVPAARIPGIESVLTMVGGRVVHGSAEYSPLSPPLPVAQPDYSPLRTGANRQ